MDDAGEVVPPRDPPLRILVVDDNPAIHDDFRKILRPAPEDDAALAEFEASFFDEAPAEASAPSAPEFEIHSAYHGEDAIAMVYEAAERREPYALAFVDVRMPPGIDGLEPLTCLWAMDPNVQAVICTAYSDYSWDQMASALGHTDQFLILKKPFDPIEVLQFAAALTRKWTLEREVESHIETLEAQVAERTQRLELMNRNLQIEVATRRRAEDELRRQAGALLLGDANPGEATRKAM